MMIDRLHTKSQKITKSNGLAGDTTIKTQEHPSEQNEFTAIYDEIFAISLQMRLCIEMPQIERGLSPSSSPHFHPLWPLATWYICLILQRNIHTTRLKREQ